MKYITKLKQIFDEFTLKNKMRYILVFNSVLILSAALLGLQISAHTYNEQLYRAVAGNLSFSSHTISNSLQSIETMSSVAFSSDTIQNPLSQIDQSTDAIVWSNSNRELNLSISNFQQTYEKKGVSCILLYNQYFRNTTDFSILNKTDYKLLEQAINNAREKNGAVSWTISPEDNLAILGRSVRRISNLDLSHIGDLLIFVDLNQIVADANLAVTTYADSQYILYDKDQLIYTSPSLSQEQAAQFYRSMQTGDSYQIIRNNGDSYFVIKNEIPYYGWTYINLIPYSQIANSTRISHYMIAAILALGLWLSLSLTKHMLRYILRDFNLLMKKMELFSNNGLEMPQIDVDYSLRHDEISRLHQHFDAMAKRIQDLVQKNYVSEILRRDASLKALKAQINPHFLYNTLETINWRAKALKDTQISSMVESLGTLLRATLSNKKKLVPLSQELELAECYMNIQKIRFEDRLSFHVACENGLEEILIPPLTIQPLLENAIRYGLEEMTETCEIGLSVFQKTEHLIIEVSNEGSVFKENLLELLQNGSQSSHGFGIGLVNIHQRIQILFGEEFGLSFTNRNDNAIAIITIPYTAKENDKC